MNRFRLAGALLVLAASAASSVAQPVTVNLGANFGGTNFSQTNSFPPDTMGAVGPNQFVEMINGRFVVYNKATGATITSSSLNSFWSGGGGPATSGSFDPRIQYDRASGRWFAISVDHSFSSSSNILVGVSNTSDPAGTWSRFSFDADPTNLQWADFPVMAVSKNWLTVSANMFDISGPNANISLLTIPKTSLLAGNTSGSAYTREQNGLADLGFTAHPVSDYLGASDTAYTLSAYNMQSGGNGILRPGSISGTLSSPTVTANNFLTVAAQNDPVGSPQSGTGTTLDGGDVRFSSTPTLVNGKIWAVQTVSVGGVNQTVWYRINPVSNTVEAQGVIPISAGLFATYASIAVNPAGDIVVGFTGSNSSQFASAYVIAGRFDGTNVTWGSETLTQAGLASYVVRDGSGRNRWGDYSSTSIDPADPGIFWSIQEYANATNNWRTNVTEVIPTHAGEIRWANAAAGSFATGGNWFNNSAPSSTDHAIFSRWSAASYQVDMPAGTTPLDRFSVRQTGTGTVTFNLAGGQVLSLTNASAATPSLAISEYQGTSNVVFSGGGALQSVNALIGGEIVSAGNLTLSGSGTTWTNSSNAAIGAIGDAGGISGTLAAGGTGSLTVTGGATATIGGQLSIGTSASSVTVGTNSSLTVGGLTSLAGAAPTVGLTDTTSHLFVNGTIDSSFAGVISGTGTLNKSGTGTFQLGGSSANTFTGVTTVQGGTLLLNKTAGQNAIGGSLTISGGTVRLGAADQLPGTGVVTLGGGTLSTGSGSGFSDTVGAFEMTADSTIALGTGSHQLKFTGFNDSSLAGTLTVTGWTGQAKGSGTAGQILVSGVTGDPNATYSSWLGTVQFQGFAQGGIFISTSTSQMFELVPVPEPTAIAAVAFGCLGVGRLVRRRWTRKVEVETPIAT